MSILNNKPNYLLTWDGQPKTVKGEKLGYLTAVMHFAPADASGANVCSRSTEGCRLGCLNYSGRGGIGLDENNLNTIQIARIQRTRYMRREPKLFRKMLAHEIDLHIKRAKRKNLVPTIRLNGTSDIPWENFKFLGYSNVFDMYSDIRFYDYTKYRHDERDLSIPNYQLTHSLAESNRQDSIDAIRNGMNVAAVVDIPKNASMPKTLSFGSAFRPMIDGDETDLRFLDPAGVIVGLRAKGPAKRDTTGFVQRIRHLTGTKLPV